MSWAVTRFITLHRDSLKRIFYEAIRSHKRAFQCLFSINSEQRRIRADFELGASQTSITTPTSHHQLRQTNLGLYTHQQSLIDFNSPVLPIDSAGPKTRESCDIPKDESETECKNLRKIL